MDSGEGTPDGVLAGESVGKGRYLLQDLLGQGGMAAVHRAHDSVLDREVAVKTLHTDLGKESSFRERFRREAQAVAKLNHPNIVAVYDSGEDMINGSHVPFIVMEYVEGSSLRDVLNEDMAEHGAMPTEKALKIAKDVLAALAASHEVGLVHRDIKPGNVMVTPRGQVKVMDFGIARALQSGVTSMTQTGMVVGTPQYLSPEQALGRGVDARSDLYSVGCMLFELLTGRTPFDGDSPFSVAYQHVQEQPPTPSSINAAVPRVVDALVLRSLAKDPGDRFPTAEAMADEVGRAIEGPGGAGGAAPLLIAGGPQARPGVPPQAEHFSSAVFPRVHSGGTPPPMAQQGPAAATPPPPNMTMPPRGQMSSGQTPPPMVAGYQQQAPATFPPRQGQAAATPPPRMPANTRAYTQGGGGPKKKGNGLVFGIIGGGVAIALIIVLAVVLTRGSGGGNPQASGSDSPTATASGTPSTAPTADNNGDSGNIPVAQRTGDLELCKSYTFSDGTIWVPSVSLKNLTWAKQCLTKAGLKAKVVYKPNSLWDKNVVTAQNPTAETNVKKNSMVTLTVSSGKTS